MLITGFEVHGSYKLFGFGKAVSLHTIAAWTLIGLWVFAIFWHFTTGEWKQYIPTMDKVVAMIKFYAVGHLHPRAAPVQGDHAEEAQPAAAPGLPRGAAVHRPLAVVLGLVLLFYGEWSAWGVDKYLSLEWVAFFHTVAAFMMLLFLIAHVYLTTAGHTPTSHIKAMITGWEEVD